MRYGEYLRSIGHPEEAVAFAAAVQEQQSVKSLIFRDNPRTYWGMGGKSYQLFGAWVANFLLIAGVLFSLAFAGIFKLIYKFSPRLQKGEPLQKSAAWGVIAGLVSPLLAVMVSLSTIGLGFGSESALLFASAVVIVALVASPFLLRFSWREIRHGQLVMAATWFSLAALACTSLTCVLFAQGISSVLEVIYGLSGGNAGVDAMKIASPWFLGGIVLSVPLGLLGLFGIFSKILRVPFAAGVTRGMRAMAVPLACVLTLCWGGVLLYTLGHERAAIAEMEQMATVGEAQYMAEILGKPFPK